MFLQTFCSNDVGTFESTAFIYFMHKDSLLVSHCQSPFRSRPLYQKLLSGFFLGVSWAPPPLSGCQAIGQSAQKSGITAVSLEKGISAGFPLGPCACGLE
jgi:hypothetical protein